MLSHRAIACVVTVGILTACSSSSNAIHPPGTGGLQSSARASTAVSAGHAHQVCPGPADEGTFRCHAWLRDDLPANTSLHPPSSSIAGYHPADLISAYQIPAETTSPTVAIIDAYDDPNAESDLAVYRSQFSLPACTSQNGCFRKVDQNGGTSYPRSNGGWSQEISLDLDMVSAICPNCKLLLVEASSNSSINLGLAVQYAASQGVVAISNSYGSTENATSVQYDSYYNNAASQGIAVTVSSGDSGYGAESPATAIDVAAAGGTSLYYTSGVWSQTAWSGAGSGCSGYNSQQIWQASITTGCTMRAEADASAVADPNTGVSVYDSYKFQGLSGWLVFGGTSVASPILAAVYTLGGGTIYNASGVYAALGGPSLYDVTSGRNGRCGAPLCSAGTGWDGVTGVGTPLGIGAFSNSSVTPPPSPTPTSTPPGHHHK